MDGKYSWGLEKYARFIQSSISASQGKWQVYSDSKEKRLTLCIKDPLNLVLQHGTEVMESFNIIQSKDWLKAIVKNDSVLFLCKAEDKVRRFRVKFAPIVTGKTDGTKQCDGFISVISAYVTVQKVCANNNSTSTVSCAGVGGSSQNRKNTAEDYSIVTVSSLTEKVLNNQATTLSDYMRKTNLPTDEAGTSSLIKTCLLDPNFPSFVESIEKTLQQMIQDP